MADQPGAEIRVIKKKVTHGGHHGGAWKVAYADFVTAMMAFFLVMWIISLSNDVKKSIAGYFDDPIGFMKAVRAGNAPFSVSELGAKGSPDDKGIGFDSVERKKLGNAKKVIERIVLKAPAFKDLKDSINIEMTEEGLRIDLVESRQSLFFDSGSARVRPESGHLLATLAREFAKLPNKIMFEGHTDNRPLARKDGYGNWELSVDRANSARRVMIEAGLQPAQVAEVRGFADRRPRSANPSAASNRRVSIVVLFTKPPPTNGTADSQPSQNPAFPDGLRALQ